MGIKFTNDKKLNLYLQSQEGFLTDKDKFANFINTNKKLNSLPLKAQELIEELTKNRVLLPSNLPNINIKYEDFSIVDSYKLKFYEIKKRRKIEPAQYDDERKMVSIKKEFFQSDRLSKFTDKNFILNFTILHEIGHAVHCALMETQNNIKVDDALLHLSNFNSNTVKYLARLPTIVAENFADIYAASALLLLDKNNPQLIHNLKEVASDRYINIKEDYHTLNSLNTLIDNPKKVQNFNHFQDLVSHIEDLTKTEIKLQLKVFINSAVGDVEKLQTLGYLSHIFTPEARDDKPIRAYLKIHFQEDFQPIEFDGAYFFEYRKIQTEKTIKSKIFSFRQSPNVTSTLKI